MCSFRFNFFETWNKYKLLTNLDLRVNEEKSQPEFGELVFIDFLKAPKQVNRNREFQHGIAESLQRFQVEFGVEGFYCQRLLEEQIRGRCP